MNIVDMAKNIMVRDNVALGSQQPILDILSNATIEFRQQDNFTIALVRTATSTSGEVHIGVSKRDTNDTPNPKRGKAISASRALREAIKYFGGYAG